MQRYVDGAVSAVRLFAPSIHDPDHGLPVLLSQKCTPIPYLTLFPCACLLTTLHLVLTSFRRSSQAQSGSAAGGWPNAQHG